MSVAVTRSPRDYDVVLFDLDGVLTRTASVYATAGRKLFDGFLDQHPTQVTQVVRAFCYRNRLPRDVGGKPRSTVWLVEGAGAELSAVKAYR